MAEYSTAIGFFLALLSAAPQSFAAPLNTQAEEKDCRAELSRESNGIKLKLKVGDHPWSTIVDSSQQAHPTARLNLPAPPPNDHSELRFLAKGTPLFHWGYDQETRELWPAQGAVTEEQLKGRLDRGGKEAGGGIYVSLSPFDSRQYGDHLVVFTPSQDLLLLAERIGDRFRFGQSCENHVLGKVGIAGRWYRSTWINLINLTSVSHVRTAELADVCRYLQHNPEALMDPKEDSARALKLSLVTLMSFDQQWALGVCPGAKGAGEIINRVLRGQSLSLAMLQTVQNAMYLFSEQSASNGSLKRTPLLDALLKIHPNSTVIQKLKSQAAESSELLNHQ